MDNPYSAVVQDNPVGIPEENTPEDNQPVEGILVDIGPSEELWTNGFLGSLVMVVDAVVEIEAGKTPWKENTVASDADEFRTA